jgi:hypothetical protein
MKRTFLIGVAAGALLAGVNLASAQTMERGGAGVEQRGGTATEQRGGGGMERGGAATERGGAATEQRGRANGEMKADSPAGNTRAQSQDNMKATTGQGDRRNAQDAQKDDNKAQDNKAQDNRAQDNKAQNAQPNERSKGGNTAQGEDKSRSSTSGQGSASSQNAGAAKTLNTEQRTRVRETVIRSSNAPRVNNVNFSVSVGTVVPRTVRYAPLPPVLVEYYPDWRGYDYFIANEQIIIIEPNSLKIVAVLDV